MSLSIGSLNIRHETKYKIEVEWKIEDFLSHPENTFKKLFSPCFKWSSNECFFTMKNSSKKEVGIGVCVFLKEYCEELGVKIDFGIKLVDNTTEVRFTITKHFKWPINIESPQFILKSELIDRQYELLPAGTLTIVCSISHLDALRKPQNVMYQNLDVLSSNLKTLYGCTKSSDMTIIVGNHRYPVHTNILAARSDVFAAMFNQDMKEKKSGVTKIDDCEPAAFEDFLLYLYTGKVENVSSSNVYQLYRIADKFNVQDLKIPCIRYMKRNMSTSNWSEIASLTNQFNEKELYSTVQDFFNTNSVEIARSDNWEEVLRQNFRVVNKLLFNALKKDK